MSLVLFVDTGPDNYHTTVVIVDCAFRATTEDGTAVNHDELVLTDANHHYNPEGEFMVCEYLESRHNSCLLYGYD